MNKQERLQNILNNPLDHKHSYKELIHCCMVDGAVDIELIEAHSIGLDMGSNGGVRCDVTSGPCCCGAWH